MQLSKIGKLVSENILGGKEDYCFDLYFSIDEDNLHKYIYSAVLNANSEFIFGRFIMKESLLAKHSCPFKMSSVEYSLTTFKPIKVEISLKIDDQDVISIVEEST